MKRILNILFVLTVTGTVAFAQPSEDRDGWREKMRAQQVSFISSEVGLTESEAQAFWPVFNDIQQQRRESFEALHQAYKALEEGAESKEVGTLLDQYVKAKNANAALEAEAVNRYKSVLPTEKVAKLLVAEEKFRHQQIGRLGKGGGPQGGPQEGGPQGGRNGHHGPGRGGERPLMP